mgnify:CR=1 FL=1
MAQLSQGAAGEIAAARFLRERGYTVISSNYRCRQGEIDIIVSDERHIVFVEVKTRRAGSLYTPREAVTAAKQRRLVATAGVFLSHHPLALQPRFDVIEVVTGDRDPFSIVEINHIQSAYETGDLSRSF